MDLKKKLTAALVALAVVGTGGVAVGRSLADNAPAPGAAAAPSTRLLGDGASEEKFVPITPCRIVDTRSAAAGKLQVGAARKIRVRGSGSSFATQGGKANGCAIPTGAQAVEVTVTAVDAGSGFLRVWPDLVSQPNATFMNYGPGINLSNTGTVALCGLKDETCTSDLDIRAYGSATDVVIDVNGYYALPMSAVVSTGGALARHSRATGATFYGTGTYSVAFDRDVTQCTYNVSLGTISAGQMQGFASATNDGANPNAVYVQTFATDGSLANKSFMVTVTC